MCESTPFFFLNVLFFTHRYVFIACIHILGSWQLKKWLDVTAYGSLRRDNKCTSDSINVMPTEREAAWFMTKDYSIITMQKTNHFEMIKWKVLLVNTCVLQVVFFLALPE